MREQLDRGRFWPLLFLSVFLVVVGCFFATARSSDSDQLTVRVLYDNVPFDASLKTHWGFSCLVEKGSTRVLFDTGAQPETLLSNVKALKLDFTNLDAIILSHIHDDHTKGLAGLSNEVVTDPPVYVLASFPPEFKQKVRAIEVTSDPMLLSNRDFRTTGELPGQMANEQALIVTTGRGLVVITGCAHPGIVQMVRRVREISGEKIHLVMGGFHLLQTPGPEVEAIAKQLRALGVERVAASHCTGPAAIEILKKEFGTDFLPSGLGRVFHIDSGTPSD